MEGMEVTVFAHGCQLADFECEMEKFKIPPALPQMGKVGGMRFRATRHSLNSFVTLSVQTRKVSFWQRLKSLMD